MMLKVLDLSNEAVLLAMEAFGDIGFNGMSLEGIYFFDFCPDDLIPPAVSFLSNCVIKD
jgi:hypothetical protein